MSERKLKVLRKVSEEERKQMSLQARVLLDILEKHEGISNQELESLFSNEMRRLSLN